MENNNHRALTEQEQKDFEKDLIAVLEKHNVDMGVTSTIQTMKRLDSFITKKDDAKKNETKPKR